MKTYHLPQQGLIILCLLILSASCRVKSAHTSTLHSTLKDSLALWQWDELVLIHERFDSLKQQPSERLRLRWIKHSKQEHRLQKDSLHHQQGKAPKPPRLAWWRHLPWWLYLLAPAIALGIIMGYVGKLHLWLRHLNPLNKAEAKKK